MPLTLTTQEKQNDSLNKPTGLYLARSWPKFYCRIFFNIIQSSALIVGSRIQLSLIGCDKQMTLPTSFPDHVTKHICKPTCHPVPERSVFPINTGIHQTRESSQQQRQGQHERSVGTAQQPLQVQEGYYDNQESILIANCLNIDRK